MLAILQGDVGVMQGVEALFRWVHVVAGVLWIGLLYFFNFVNSSFAPTMDADTKKKVVPQLMPRALFFFRWGAAYTFVFGLFLLFIVYYHGSPSYLTPDGTKPAPGVWLQAFLGLLVGFAVYDLLFKTLGKTQHALAVVLWGLLSVGFAGYMIEVLESPTRAAFLHVGALFGTSMAANVWMRIWPAQRRIITAVRDGKAPDAADVGMAGLRSKHNTYMSVPLLLLMVCVHVPWLTGTDPWWAVLVGILVLGFVATRWIYAKAASVKGF